MARGRYQPNVAEVRHKIRGPHPITDAQIAALDVAYGRGMAGGTGTVRIGEKSSSVVKYSGELGPLQRFAGARIQGATPSVLGTIRAQTALPATSAPLSVPNPVLDLLRRTQAVTQ